MKRILDGFLLGLGFWAAKLLIDGLVRVLRQLLG